VAVDDARNGDDAGVLPESRIRQAVENTGEEGAKAIGQDGARAFFCCGFTIQGGDGDAVRVAQRFQGGYDVDCHDRQGDIQTALRHQFRVER